MSNEYIQGGANFPVPADKKKSKKLLKELLKENPSAVTLFATSQMGPQYAGPASGLPDNVTFNVVGPDPYTKRDWYASVKKGASGNLVCT